MKKYFVKLTIFFAVAFILLLFAWILFGYYADTVPVFEVLITPLLWLWIIACIITAVFITLIVIKVLKDKDN